MTTTYKVLGQVCPTGTGTTALYTVPAGTQVVGSTISFCNISGSAVTFDWHVRPAGAAVANTHYQDKGARLEANDSIKMSLGLTLAATDVVSVKSSAADALAVSLYGTEITTP